MNPVHVSPIYPNKWKFYMAPLISDTALLEFNWFICARPSYDSTGNHIVEVDRYAMFFDESSGLTYHVTFDATEKGPCKILIGDVTKDFEKSKKLGYCGVASVDKEKCNISCSLLCGGVDFLFDPKVVEVSKKCPYIEYAKSHFSHLQKEIKNFPTPNILATSKPGAFSLKMKKMIDSYLSV
mgnify:CR=1 FL=1